MDEGIEFYNRSMKSRLQYNDIKLFSAHNEGKSIIIKRFIRAWKNKIYDFKITKSLYIYKLYDIVKKCNNTYLTKIKITSVDEKSSTYIDFNVKKNNKNPKYGVGDHVQIPNYKNILAKGYALNWFEEAFMIKKINLLCLRHML